MLLEALDVRAGDTCLSIASAGDNALALLTRGPERVVALDLSAAQLACVELRVAAYRALDYPEVLEMVGSRPSRRRDELYRRCRPLLGPDTRGFWDSRSPAIRRGIGSAGRLESYFALFRSRVLPFVHPRQRVARLLRGGSVETRRRFFDSEWNTWRWRTLFRAFFSRFVMERMGREPSFFAHVRRRHRRTVSRKDAPCARGTRRLRKPISALDAHGSPRARASVRASRRKLRRDSREPRPPGASTPDARFLRRERRPRSVDRFNLSDVFEYVSETVYRRLLDGIARVGRPGARLAYWNLLVPRGRPESMASTVRSLSDLSRRLHERDRGFFYEDFVVEEVA